ncbi:MAG: UbiA family prenyltransferase, partial [Euryarchaeota archaeon]
DVDVDRVSKAHKPIPSGRISIESAKKTAYRFAFLSLLLMAIGANATKDPIPVSIIWLTAFLLMYTYDSGPKTKNSGFIGNVAISLMVGAVILFGAAAVSKVDTTIVIYASIVAFFANLAREIVKDCEDMETDEGRNTLPMRIGLDNARAVAYVFVLLSMITLGLAHLYGPFEYHQILFHGPAIFIMFSLNGPLFRGEDYAAQQKIRVGMLLGLIAFALQVSIL